MDIGSLRISDDWGKKHDIKGSARDDLPRLGRAYSLCCLVPPLCYHAFTKKSSQDIDHYVGFIPYPE